MREDTCMQKENSKSTAFEPIDRRRFLKVFGGGIIITFSFELPLHSAETGRPASSNSTLPTRWDAFIKVGEDGKITCYTGKIEMGQGIITSLAQMAAEELDVPLASIEMIMGDTALCPWDMGTFGSRSTKYFGPPLREAAAEAKAVLMQLASGRLSVPVEQLQAKDGVISASGNPPKQVTYADLAKGKRIERQLQPKPPIKPVTAHTLSGKPVLRTDARDKVTGKALFTGDIRLPGMMHGKVLRPPAHGAKLRKADTSGAEKIKGAQVIREGDFIAVLHASPDIAQEAISAIKTEYDLPVSNLHENSIHQHLSNALLQGETIAGEGNVEKGKTLSSKTSEATYYVPYVAHTPMETHTALARMESDGITVWASTQRPFGAQGEVAETLGILPDQVRIITPFVGGGFGSKSRNGQVIEAARLAKLSGKSVQVAWTREEEFFNDAFQPAAFVHISSGINDSNKIIFWNYQVCFAGERASQPLYDMKNFLITSHGSWFGSPGAHPFPVGAWRGPGVNTNTFARESHIDVMAFSAGMDPLSFRILNLSDERMLRVLETAAQRFGWTSSRLPSGRGYGVACTSYQGTYVATIAETEVERSSGKVTAKRVVCAQDMGEIINPEGARIQIEGCITMGLGYALTEELRFKGGNVLDLNFDTYEIPRFSWLPKIEVVLIDNPDIPAQGCGEPAITCLGAVLANAIFDATGARLNRLPMTPERIKKAILSV